MGMEGNGIKTVVPAHLYKAVRAQTNFFKIQNFLLEQKWQALYKPCMVCRYTYSAAAMSENICAQFNIMKMQYTINIKVSSSHIHVESLIDVKYRFLNLHQSINYRLRSTLCT